MPDRFDNRQLIDALRRSRMFRDYEAVFSKATGLPLALRPLEYWQLAHHGKKNENAFCALLAENPRTLSVCLQAHEAMIRHTGDAPHTVTCPFGLSETAVPVKLAEKTIGYLRIGQVLRRSPQRADTAKAREYIERHKSESLSLATVANAAGASVFHFCKVFRKATGVKFTEYVTRVRLEDARTQLLNPNRRISEIAYDVGFQSLTQFNRMFKRVFGQSPTDFRAHHSSAKDPARVA